MDASLNEMQISFSQMKGIAVFTFSGFYNKNALFINNPGSLALLMEIKEPVTDLRRSVHVPDFLDHSQNVSHQILYVYE